jgi:hypothetical protein
MQTTEKILSENERIQKFIKDYQLKNDYNPRFFEQYNAKFNAEFNQFLIDGNFSQQTINLFFTGCLFEVYQLQPENLKELLQRYDFDNLNYKDCENLLIEVQKIGYTFEFGLDAVPFNLQNYTP